MTDFIVSKKASSVNPPLEPWAVLFRLAEEARERGHYLLFCELRREGLRRQYKWWKVRNPEGE